MSFWEWSKVFLGRLLSIHLCNTLCCFCPVINNEVNLWNIVWNGHKILQVGKSGGRWVLGPVQWWQNKGHVLVSSGNFKLKNHFSPWNSLAIQATQETNILHSFCCFSIALSWHSWVNIQFDVIGKKKKTYKNLVQVWGFCNPHLTENL